MINSVQLPSSTEADQLTALKDQLTALQATVDAQGSATVQVVDAQGETTASLTDIGTSISGIGTQLEQMDMKVVSHSTPAVAPFTAATEVLPANSSRVRALVQIEGGSVRVDDAVNGIITADPVRWEAQTALILHPQDGATIAVRILEELGA